MICWPGASSASAGCELESSGLCCPLLAGSSSPGQVNAAQWVLDGRADVNTSWVWSIINGITHYKRKQQREPPPPGPPCKPCTPPASSSPSCNVSRSRPGPSAAAGSGWWRVWAAGMTAACCWYQPDAAVFAGLGSPWWWLTLFISLHPDEVAINYCWGEAACTTSHRLHKRIRL